MSPLLAGCCLLPLAVMTFVLAPLSGRLVGTRGPRVPLLLAGALLTLGGLLLVPLSAHESLGWVIAGVHWSSPPASAA